MSMSISNRRMNGDMMKSALGGWASLDMDPTLISFPDP